MTCIGDYDINAFEKTGVNEDDFITADENTGIVRSKVRRMAIVMQHLEPEAYMYRLWI